MATSITDPTTTTTSSTTTSPTSTSTTPTTTTSPSTSTTTTATTPTVTSTSTTPRTSTSTTTTSSTISSTTPAVVTASTTSQPSVTSPTTQIPGVVTRVSTTFISESQSPTSTGTPVQSTGSRNSFFANKGAVAGVFTVVGLIGLVLFIVLIVNIIRRRRAHKFDKELIAATREAAAATPNPNFLDDEEDPEDRFKRGAYGMGYGSGGNGAGYSDVSHGTYGQPPMEAYNMRDLGGHGTGIGEIYDPYAAGGAAGIGVARARSMRVDPANATPNSYAAALQDGGSPYPKFAIGPHDTYSNGGGGGGASFGRGPNTNLELLEAAGMGNHVAGAGMISRGQQQQQYQQGPEYPSLGRNKSSSTGTTQLYQPSTSSTPSYSSYPQQPYPTRQLSPQQTLLAPSGGPPLPPNLPNPYTQGPPHTVEPLGDVEDAEDAYGGYIVEDSTIHNSAHGHGQPQASGSKYMTNPFDRGRSNSPEVVVEDRRYEKEEEEPKRVLKVANE